jgi:ubiquinone/menaquinone biosynthesis C-methylase UbiE
MHPHSDDRLVLRVNELFHDIEAKRYDADHPEIFEDERLRWERLLDRFLPTGHPPLAAADIGCGTGFVSVLLARRLNRNDSLLCSDISREMLAVCREAIRASGADCEPAMRHLDGQCPGLPPASLDVVTINSVLHHLPDPDAFLREVAQALKPGGLFIIGHEPNRGFWGSWILRTQWSLIRSVIRGITGQKRRHAAAATGTPQQDSTLAQVNAALRADGLITEDLTPEGLSMLIDVHSPTAGGVRLDEGFDAAGLFEGALGLRTIHLETYNYLPKFKHKRWAMRAYESVVGVLFPRSGATFFLVARKDA